MTRETLLRKPACSLKTWLIAAIVTAIALLGALVVTAENSYASTYEGTVSFNMTDDGKPVMSDKTGEAMMLMEVDLQEVADTDLAEWDLEEYSYTDYNTGEPDPEAPTLLKLYLYLLNNHYVDAGDGEALRASGAVHSFFMEHFWGHDCNLLYYVNGTYPLYEGGWGATADGIILNEGDRVDVAMFTDWGFFGDPVAGFNFFADADSEPEDGVIVDSYEATAGVPIPVQVIRGMGDVTVGQDTSYQAAGDLTIHVSEPNGVIDVDDESDMTLEEGRIDLTFDEPGEYYIWVDGGIGENIDKPVQSGAAARVTVTEAPAPHTHDWGEPEYAWSEDKAKVKAKRVCGTDVSHIEEEEVETTSSIIKDPSTTAEGIKEYVAKFKNTAFETQTARESIPKLEPNDTKTIVVAARNFAEPSEFDVIPQEVEVSSDAAESFGNYGDIIYGDNNGKITLADVLYTIHKNKYGEDFTKETAENYIDINSGGWNQKLFGKDANASASAINEDLTMTGSSYETTVEDGDQVDMWAFLDTVGWSDPLTRFDKKEYIVRAGEEFQVHIAGIGWSGPIDVAKVEGEDFTAATYNDQGKLTPIDGAVMDSDSKIKLTFAEEGEYSLSASGKVATSGWDGSPVTADAVIPWAKLRVISAEGSQQVEEELTAADDAVQTGAAAAEEAQKSQTTADASRKAAEEAMKTPGQKAVDAAKKAQKDAEDAVKAANEAKAAADAAVEAAKKAADEAVTDAEKNAAAEILNNAEKLAEKAEANKKAADEALLKANAMVKSAEKAAALAKTKKVKKVIVNVKTVNKKAVDKAVKKAGGSNKYVTTIVLGKKVKKIKKNTFKTYKKVKTVEVRTKKLTKKSVKGSLKGSKVKTIKVKVGSKKTNKKYVMKYKKIFTKKTAGKKVKVRR